MRWTRGHRSENVEDRRAQRVGGGSMGGAGLLISLAARFGLPGLLVGAALLYFAGGNLFGSESPQQVQPSAGSGEPGESDPEAPMVEFVSFVLDDVQDTWQAKFAQRGASYRDAKLILFRSRTPSACGMGAAAMGPFYCPRDQHVYIDLSFYRELKQRFGAPGDFAQAYVIAHEIGHHVQHLLELDERARGEREGADSGSVRLELQADCLAGVWANATDERQLLEAGDVEEALGAAAAIGDDRLQRQSTGTVTPETWTHGSSAQRVRWFKRGYQNGSIEACDTFSATEL